MLIRPEKIGRGHWTMVSIGTLVLACVFFSQGNVSLCIVAFSSAKRKLGSFSLNQLGRDCTVSTSSWLAGNCDNLALEVLKEHGERVRHRTHTAGSDGPSTNSWQYSPVINVPEPECKSDERSPSLELWSGQFARD